MAKQKLMKEVPKEKTACAGDGANKWGICTAIKQSMSPSKGDFPYVELL
jgi:hypothetical protein